MFFFYDDGLDEDKKRDIAFQTVVGIRDTINLAKKQQQPATYEQSLRLIYDLDPELYRDFDRILTEKNDNDIVKLYREEAKLQSEISGKKIEPEDLIEKEIDRLKTLKSDAEAKLQDVKHINRRIAQLYSAIENLKPRHLTENAILIRDFAQLDHSTVFGEKIMSDYKYVDYVLQKDRFLRLRLLHPDREEHITGADLIYEQYDLINNKVRFVFLQYKTWDNSGILYFSQHENLKPQLLKLKTTLCDCEFCDPPISEDFNYRMPYCCAFLRPTDKLQIKNSKMVSSGLLIPVCKSLVYSDKQIKLDKRELKYETLNHYVFEKMFNNNLLGSRWFDADDVEEFYKEKLILESHDTLKIYAREFVNSKVPVLLDDNDEPPF
ncbi:hypothetical protein MTO98_04575 [Mucilaginibacter sp. SMC90]|uniref:hypothetical protein n=1 Tax=Mucilaginibacter sp. SMC90 TaxID=2929803 RepID=UPI001FB438E4|nr:hypothetical protein [Mucilaginibacter sp. SMC90]UOE50346.1 hypothetical protein MTO98_04575 [Mucilaginibacter sp. SMC90]